MAAAGLKEAAAEQVNKAAQDRAEHKRPSPPRALLAALIVGVAAAVVTYQLLRS